MKTVVQCRDCGQERINHGRRLCGACYQARWRTGLPRPSYDHPLWARLRAVKLGRRYAD